MTSDASEGVGMEWCSEVGDRRCFDPVSNVQSGSRLLDLTNASKPCGACMTELGCSSSSDLGFRASEAALEVSS